MIISHKYKFIFIKTYKTAGTSIEVYLSPLCGPTDIITPIEPHVDPHKPQNYRGLWNPLPEIINNKGRGTLGLYKNFLKRKKFYNHISARLIKNRVAAHLWKSYFKFCVERNPWDKSLSHYHMINSISGGKISFDQYLATGDYCLNYPKYTSKWGGILVDRVIKYEHLNSELSCAFKSLGVPFDGALTVKAKAEHRKDRRSYREVLTSRQKNIIKEIFAKEIEMHKYTY